MSERTFAEDPSGAPPPAPEGPRARRISHLQSWRDLLFLHWPAPPAELEKLIPRRLSLDYHQGQAFVGIVAFSLHGLRPRWFPRSLGLRFLETNLRTYVRLGEKRGVHFFSLDAASRLAVAGARAAYGLPYHFARMRLSKREGGIEYALRRASGSCPGFRAIYRTEEVLEPACPGTLAHFLIERRTLFVEWRGKLRSVGVRHSPYPLHAVKLLEMEQDLLQAAGISPAPGAPPHVHYSPGADVEVLCAEIEQGQKR